MTPTTLQTLADLVRDDRDALLLAWRMQVRQLPSASHLDTPTLNDHIPDLLEELASALETNPEVIAVSCPFCMTMLSDGIKAKDLEERVQTLDVVEIVDRVAK